MHLLLKVKNKDLSSHITGWNYEITGTTKETGNVYRIIMTSNLVNEKKEAMTPMKVIYTWHDRLPSEEELEAIPDYEVKEFMKIIEKIVSLGQNVLDNCIDYDSTDCISVNDQETYPVNLDTLEGRDLLKYIRLDRLALDAQEVSSVVSDMKEDFFGIDELDAPKAESTPVSSAFVSSGKVASSTRVSSSFVASATI